jgi:flagellar motor switch protein FliN/FliY
MMSQADIERMLAGMSGEGDSDVAMAPAPAAPPAESPPIAQQSTPAPAPTPQQAPPMQQAPQMQQAPPMQQAPQMPPMPQMQQEGYMGYPPPMYYYPPQMPPQMGAQAEPKVISTKPLNMQHFDVAEELGPEQAQNLDLIMEVPLQVTVEIGRTRRKVQDILAFSKGALVVLDKLAGDQVDLLVNGQLIARGDVVVIEDNFGIRITEILQKPNVAEMLKK